MFDVNTRKTLHNDNGTEEIGDEPESNTRSIYMCDRVNGVIITKICAEIKLRAVRNVAEATAQRLMLIKYRLLVERK